MYTIKRNETFHFNYRLSDKIYRKSLKTDSPSLSRAYVSDILIFIRKAKLQDVKVSKKDIDVFIEMLISNKVNEVSRIGKAINNPLSDTAANYFNEWFIRTDSQRSNQFNYDLYCADEVARPKYPSYSDWLSSKLESTANFSQLYYHFSSYNYETEEMELDAEHDHYMDMQYPTIYSEKYKYLDEIISKQAIRIAKANREGLPVGKEIEEIHQKFADMLPIQEAPAINTELNFENDNQLKSSILFDEIEDKDFYSFLKSNMQQSDKYVKDRISIFEDLKIAFTGLNLRQITADDIEERWASICRLPKMDIAITEKYGFAIDAKGKSAEEAKQEKRIKRWNLIYEIDFDQTLQLDENDLYAAGQLKFYSKLLQDIFIFAKRKDYITSNPFKDEDINLNIPKNRSTTRTVLPKDKAASIVNHCTQNLEDPHSWPILLMAYLGLRNKEATSLLADQIITDPETNTVYIQILKGKTKNARRKVPVHKRLLELGFQSLVDRTEQKQRLFNVESKHLTQMFSKFRSLFDIPKLDNDGSQLVLYSFRHNVISFLGDSSDEQKYRLIGHGHYTVTTNYTKLDLTKAQELINKVKYD